MTNTKTDQYGMIAKAKELLPRLTLHRTFNKNELESLLSEYENQYKAVEQDLLSHLRLKSHSVKTVSELIALWLDSTSAFGIIMVRADLKLQPLINNTRNEADMLADSIRCYEQIEHMCVDTIFGNGVFGEEWNRAGSVAKDAFSGEHRGYSSVLPILPILDYINKTSCKLGCENLTEFFEQSSSADAILRTETARRFPLIGFLEEVEFDNIFGDSNDLGCLGFRSYDPWDKGRTYIYNSKNNSAFVSIFADKVNELYRTTTADSNDYFTVSLWRNSTYKCLIQYIFEVAYDSDSIFNSINHFIDLANDGVELTYKDVSSLDYQRFMNPEETILQRNCDIKSGVTMRLNEGLLLDFVEMIEVLGLSDLQQGFTVVADKVRKL